jgi:hypothetical protein
MPPEAFTMRRRISGSSTPPSSSHASASASDTPSRCSELAVCPANFRFFTGARPLTMTRRVGISSIRSFRSSQIS